MTGTFKSWLYEYDIVLFFEETTGLIADDFQKDFLRTDAEDILLLWCRQGSKTTVAAVREAHGAMFTPGSLGLVVSATQRQAGILQKRIAQTIRNVTRRDKRKWRKVKSLELPEDPLDLNSKLVRCSVLSLELGNGSEIVSLPPHPDTIRGYSPDRITLDEASRIPDVTYDALRPMRAAHPCTLSVLSTPKATFGFFYREVTGNDSVWWRSRMDANQCLRITDEFLARERLKMTSEAMFRCEYFLEFMNIKGALLNQEQVDGLFVLDEEDKKIAEAYNKERDIFHTSAAEEWEHNFALAKENLSLRQELNYDFTLSRAKNLLREER